MLTLNQATSMTKNLSKGIAVFLAGIFLIFVLFRLGVLIKNIVAPTPPPPPTVSFGTLPEIKFPVSIDEKNYSFTIDTVTGELPDFPDRSSIFKIVENDPDLLALEKTGKIVSRGGFTLGPQRINENIYQWQEPNSAIGKKIQIDIFTSEFIISSSYFTNPTILSGENFPDASEAKVRAQSYLKGLTLFPDDIDTDNTKVNFFTIQDSQLVPVDNPSNAHVARVDLFQKNIEKLPILYPNPTTSTMNVLIGGGKNPPEILQAEFIHQKISEESSTYPIITPEKAFAKLEEGKAYIASPGTDDEILIQKIFLAYFLSNERQEYLMPIVVFEGNNGFTAYLSAVTDEWIDK